MQFSQLSLALILSSVPAVVLAAPTTPTAPTAPAQLTQEEWIKRMTDFTQNGSALRDPKLFVQWSNAITEPSFYPLVAQGVMDPSGWLNMANSAANPDAFRNWARTADPQVAMRWAGAMADPAFYTTMTTQFADPGKMMRWVMVPMDPRWVKLGTEFFNPNLYIKWGASGMDPRTWNLMGNVMNPALYTSVAGAAMDPKSYGPTWAAIPSPVGNTPQPLPWSGNYGVNGAPFNGWFNWKPMPAYGVTDPWTQGANGGNSFSFIPSMDSLGGFVGSLLPGSAAAPAVVKPAAAPAKVGPVAAEKVAPQPAATPVASGKIVLSGDALFKSGSADLKAATPEGQQQLAELVKLVQATPNVGQITIVGHADPTGNRKSNRKLSAARAKAVKQHLAAAGVKPAVIVSSGLGGNQPLVKCDAKLPKADKIACNAPNRRVEVELLQVKPK